MRRFFAYFSGLVAKISCDIDLATTKRKSKRQHAEKEKDEMGAMLNILAGLREFIFEDLVPY